MKRRITIGVILFLVLVIGGLWWNGGRAVPSQHKNPPSHPPATPPAAKRGTFLLPNGERENVIASLKAAGKEIHLGESLERLWPYEQFWQDGRRLMECVMMTQRRVFANDILLVQRDVIPSDVHALTGGNCGGWARLDMDPVIVYVRRFAPDVIVHELAHANVGASFTVKMPQIISEGIARLCELEAEGDGSRRRQELRVNWEEVNSPGLTTLDGRIQPELASLQYILAGELFFRLYRRDHAVVGDLLDAVEKGELNDWRDYLEFFRARTPPEETTFLLSGFQPGVYVLRAKDFYLDPPEDVYVFFRRDREGNVVRALFHCDTDTGEFDLLAAEGTTMRLQDLRERFPSAQALTVRDEEGNFVRTITLRD